MIKKWKWVLILLRENARFNDSNVIYLARFETLMNNEL